MPCWQTYRGMDELKLRINAILAAWNPLSVPADIASCEYLSYVQKVADAIMDNRQIRHVLLQMIDNLGMEKPYGSDIIKDVNDISRQISALVNDWSCLK